MSDILKSKVKQLRILSERFQNIGELTKWNDEVKKFILICFVKVQAVKQLSNIRVKTVGNIKLVVIF